MTQSVMDRLLTAGLCGNTFFFLFNLYLTIRDSLRLKKSLLQECSGQNGQQYISFITTCYNTDRLETLKNSYMSLSQFPFADTLGQDIQTLTYHSSTSNMAFHLKDVCSSNFTWPLNMMLT